MVTENIRLLAAIMFADMVGYTELMQEDEQLAKKYRDRQREILEDSILEHRGNVIQYYGDGSLCIFGSAIEAVKCAIDIQTRLRENEPRIQLRIGLHLGDIVYDDEGAYGDAVNLAARIEALSIPGGVLMSDRVNDELQGHPGIRTASLGKHDLKHIKRPVEIFAVHKKGLNIPTVASIKAKTGSSSQSIAVLPFVNMSGDVDNEYFSDGITEEIINALTRVDGLNVTSRTSSFAFKKQTKDVRKIGAELNVRYLLEGSVRRAANQVRITAQLINTTDGFHIWSEVFDRDLEDIFQVQDEISKKIATKLNENVKEVSDSQRLVQQGTDNIRAYNHYLKGKYYWHKWTPEDAQKSIEQFNHALDICPDYAEAYAGLAMSYSFLGAIGQTPSHEAYRKAEEAARKSLKYDDRISASHTALALVKVLLHWDFTGAQKHFEKALALGPESANVKQAYALFLKVQGRNKEAIRVLKEALEQDPLSLTINAELARAYLNAGKKQKALEQFSKTLELDANFRTAIEGKGWAYVALREYEKAEKIFEDYRESIAQKRKGITPLGYIYGKLGKTKKAEQILKLMSQREEEDENVSLAMDFAVVYLGLGDKEKVFKYLNQALDEHLGGILFIKTNPIWKEIWDDERFDEIIDAIGLNEKLAVVK